MACLAKLVNKTGVLTIEIINLYCHHRGHDGQEAEARPERAK